MHEEESDSLQIISTLQTHTALFKPNISRVVMSSTELDRTLLGRALCVVTGASRGFGRTVAREMSRCLKSGSALVIVARSGDDLRSLQAELTKPEAAAAAIVVRCVVADLGQVDGPEIVAKASKEAFSEDMDHIILVNNAGRWRRGSVRVCWDKSASIVSERRGTWARSHVHSLVFFV